MRVLLQVELDTPTANGEISAGKMGEVMDGILGQLKPEAAYFYAKGGRRAMTLVVDLADETHLPSICEPFWLQLSATVETYVCMDGDDLRAGLARLG